MVLERKDELETYAAAFAFIGNSLLAPMSQTSDTGLDPDFWAAFPDCGSAEVRAALEGLEAYAREMRDVDDAAVRVSVEFTHLFIGPPRPAAAPWETFYLGEDVTVGFGRATFQMRDELRRAGLVLSNENNQYEDHAGIELLLLSELLRRAAHEDGALEEALAFARRHPASWFGAFRAAVQEAVPSGYYAHLLVWAEALLASLDGARS